MLSSPSSDLENVDQYAFLARKVEDVELGLMLGDVHDNKILLTVS